ncbi:tetratricopeptide repeat protein [Natronosporangium hydrolyticum]|uniref:Tetratricopeptide repeat protein n=1 Tax=Natronosporangium hydrolyticum TaxID=2811111 RepID=A0A895YM82_9ACTN|nr:FxSxx-COOH system tetratricopeptide repeat protein [Natronosporangium hydrolyticum]QSB15796.1 tetratricopeptide repeat protein [Natronosporangium hydrolyticum]
MSDPSWQQVAEAVWLATRISSSVPATALPSPARTPEVGRGLRRADSPPTSHDESRARRDPAGSGRPVPAVEASTMAGKMPAADPPRPRVTQPVLPGAGAIARRLRPLRQPVPSRHIRLLDEAATAERAAQDGLWLPVWTPAPAPRWDAVVVADDHVSMTIWWDQVAEFVALLRRQAAFHEVHLRRLHTDTKDPAEVQLSRPGRRHHPVGLPATDRQRIIFVLTDGAGPAWSAGVALPEVGRWARRAPVAIVQLLPQQHWHRSGLCPERLRLWAPRPGAANGELSWWRREPWLEPADESGSATERPVPVPVLELRPRWLAAWAQLVAGDHGGWLGLPAVLATRPAPAAVDTPAVPAEPGERRPAARQRVREFAARATPLAVRLAGLLAAAPLSVALIRELQHRLLPDSDATHLAEVLTSGLLRPVPEVAAGESPMVTLEFEPGVREELLTAGRRADAPRVWRVVEAVLGAAVPAVAQLSRVIDDPERTPLPPVTAETVAFLRVEQAVLRALSGRYLDRARRLDDQLGGPPETDTARHSTVGREDVTMDGPADIHQVRPPEREGVGVSTSSSPSATAPSTAAPRTPSKPPAIWGNIPPRNPNFTGRSKLLELLHEQMQGGATAVLPHALHGMGGVGKSHLAIEYVYRHQSEYDLIWWIPAERSAQIGASLVELAQRMNLPAGPDVASARNAVQEALRLGSPYAKWLLVFDNAESPEAVRQFFPAGGTGSIMVTSRNPHWASVARTLEVDVFTREESVQLLRLRGPDLDDVEADRLAEALGDLPLALEQAAAWRAETGMPAEEYLRLFERKRIDLLAQAAPMDYQLPVAAAWNVSLDRLVVSNPAAFRLLQLCSFLAPEPIPRTLLGGAHNTDVHPELNAALRDPMRLNRAIRDINRYALARVNHRTNSIQMHRLIQAVLNDRMSEPERESMRSSAHLLLASGDRNDPNSPANWRSYAELYPHVEASGAILSPVPWVQQLVENEAKYLYWGGDYEASLDLSRRAYETWRGQLGQDASATLKIGHWLGFMLYMLGHYAEAAQHNAEILAAYQRTTSEDSEELLKAVGAVAADRRVAGDFAAALEMEQDLYQRHVRALGIDDPNTLNAAHNLAVSLRLTGDLSRAYEVDQDTYERRVLLFGEDHAFTQESLLNLVIDRRELGEFITARIQMQDIVDRLRQEQGAEQTQTLRALRRLASAVRKAGDHRTARQLSEEARDGYASRYGENNPDALLAALGLAVDLRATGHFDEAVQLGEQVQDEYRRLFGADHPYTVAAQLNVAISRHLRGDVARSRQINEDGVSVLTRLLGADHPLSLAGAVNLANDLYAQGEVSAAHARDLETADRMRRVFGPEHPTTLICLGNLAMDLLAMDRQSEAYELHAEVSAGLHRALGENHPATVAGSDLTVRGTCDLDPMPL